MRDAAVANGSFDRANVKIVMRRKPRNGPQWMAREMAKAVVKQGGTSEAPRVQGETSPGTAPLSTAPGRRRWRTSLLRSLKPSPTSSSGSTPSTPTTREAVPRRTPHSSPHWRPHQVPRRQGRHCRRNGRLRHRDRQTGCAPRGPLKDVHASRGVLPAGRLRGEERAARQVRYVRRREQLCVVQGQLLPEGARGGGMGGVRAEHGRAEGACDGVRRIPPRGPTEILRGNTVIWQVLRDMRSVPQSKGPRRKFWEGLPVFSLPQWRVRIR